MKKLLIFFCLSCVISCEPVVAQKPSVSVLGDYYLTSPYGYDNRIAVVVSNIVIGDYNIVLPTNLVGKSLRTAAAKQIHISSFGTFTYYLTKDDYYFNSQFIYVSQFWKQYWNLPTDYYDLEIVNSKKTICSTKVLITNIK